MPTIAAALSLFLSIPPTAAAVPASDSALICMAPVTAQVAGGQNAEAVTAVREAFGSYLTGPTLGVVALTAKLPSQAREEAKRAGCQAVLFVSVKHERNNPSSLLGKVAGRVETQAWQVAAKARSSATKELAQAAAKTARDVERHRGYNMRDGTPGDPRPIQITPNLDPMLNADQLLARLYALRKDYADDPEDETYQALHHAFMFLSYQMAGFRAYLEEERKKGEAKSE